VKNSSVQGTFACMAQRKLAEIWVALTASQVCRCSPGSFAIGSLVTIFQGDGACKSKTGVLLML
jgi:hypothetical protein